MPAGATASPVDPAPARRGGRRRKLGAYVALTKPRIIELLLVTTVPTMVLAERGLPDLLLVLATLVGGTLAAGSANTLNCYLDRDIDKVMHRTSGRPLVTGAVTPREALTSGVLLGVASVLWLGLVVNWLAAGLALAAIAFYVVVYTLGLKRRTPQNIVWGGAAGCMPVLIGWAAVIGSLSWAPVVLFAVIFFWTPPHYWPLSLRYAEDYGRAGVPMLGVVADEAVVTRRVLVYSYVMVAVSLLLWPVAPTGWLYGALALVLGAAFLLEAHRLDRRARRGLRGRELGPMRLFHGSISYLTLLFVAIALDPLLLG
ncbi:protoheme IX farnesyltransferase [Vallicoccus soli]|uniref:Protoheme IX farnesyltransferase n=1 Tax=Vallicoccus soli TaxID=2339232 RepID=A0A3A3YUD8_9ACTN|nr:protoheme IX farnesyltransferase [Vallicoccus soli]